MEHVIIHIQEKQMYSLIKAYFSIYEKVGKSSKYVLPDIMVLVVNKHLEASGDSVGLGIQPWTCATKVIFTLNL